MASESKYAPGAESSNGPLDNVSDSSIDPVNPFLTEPILYISELDSNFSDKELASSVFSKYLPIRLHLDREQSTPKIAGKVEFQSIQQAEKAYATLRFPNLSIKENSEDDPKPEAKPRLIKQLPFGTEDVDVYDLFRPFGSIYKALRILSNPQGHHTGFRGMALVTYYTEEEAQRGQTEMHCVEVEGKSISVTIDNVTRKASISSTTAFSASAAPFVPSTGSKSPTMSATAPAFRPPTYGSNPSLQFPAQAPTFVDPRNLFCKNLDANVDSHDLYNLFKEFGNIVSARVMRDEHGVSREFGFVSFKNAAEASKALNAMNGIQQGSKQMIVRLHEPKNFRQEKLSHKFGTSYVPNSPGNEGTTSENQDSPSGDAEVPRARRTSNSYFRAAENGENGQMNVTQLQSMNATLRGDILRGGFNRRIKELDDIPAGQVDVLVESLCELRLADAVNALNDTDVLNLHIKEIQAQQDSLSNGSANGDGIQSEREKFLNAVKELLPGDAQIEEITDLLVGLPKKDRAKALFSQDILRTKVEEAKGILELEDEEEIAKSTTNGTKKYTLSELSQLSALEIIQLINDPQNSNRLPVSKADENVVKETDAFIDEIKDLPAHDQKQKLGDQLFKKIRSFGVKGGSKITIKLLDSEDLRSLAHLMNSYPECLREKVSAAAAATNATSTS